MREEDDDAEADMEEEGAKSMEEKMGVEWGRDEGEGEREEVLERERAEDSGIRKEAGIEEEGIDGETDLVFREDRDFVDVVAFLRGFSGFLGMWMSMTRCSSGSIAEEVTSN